jgi:serine/threonine protein kinase
MESIGRYKIIRELGRGAMGVVYLAEDPAIGRSVAIKTINLDNLSEPGQEQMLRDRLMREARSAGILSHPGIVTVYDIQQSGNLACIVMEFVEGVTLYDRMIRGELKPDEALSIMEQSAAAIDYAHSKGVLHRDIKPANLMFTTEGQVKVADFGVARLSSQKTATSGMVLGTPSYMAPEQISNKALGPATDQFSLAVMAFELLTGQKPFDGDSISGLLYCIVFQDPVSVRSLNSTLPEAVEAVLNKALSKEPADRYPNCSAFARALKAACETRKTWKPVRTVRGSQIAVPADLAAAGGTMAAWGTESEAPAKVPAQHPTVMQASTSVIPTPVPLPAPAAKKPEPQPAAKAPAKPVVAEAPPKSEPKKSESKKIAIAFAASFVVILAVYMIWQATRPAEVAPNVAAEVPSGAAQPAASPIKEAAKKVASPTPAPGAVSAAVEAAKPGPAAAQTFPLEIQTQPPKATVTVKDKTCVTPCQLDLTAGEYYVKAELEGYTMAFQRVQVPKELELSLQLQKPVGTIQVRGPAGATIHVNGKPWKDKAPARFQLEQGTYTIVIEFPDGGKTPEQKIEVTEGKIFTLQ